MFTPHYRAYRIWIAYSSACAKTERSTSLPEKGTEKLSKGFEGTERGVRRSSKGFEGTDIAYGNPTSKPNKLPLAPCSKKKRAICLLE